MSSTHGSRWCGAVIMWIRKMSSTHGSRWWGAVIMWIRKMSSTHGSRWWGAVIMWIRKCSLHTAAADEGLLSCEFEVVPYTRQPLMRGWYPVNEWGAKWLCFANSRTLLWGGGCMLTQWVFPCGICGDVRSLCSRICLRLSAPPRKGAWEAGLMSCPAGSTVRGMGTFSRHELITWVPKVHRWSEGRRTTFKKMSYSPERCRGAAVRPALEWANLHRELK